MENEEKTIKKSKKWTYYKILIIFVLFLILYIFLRAIDVRLFVSTPLLEGVSLDILLVGFIGLVLFYSILTYLNFKYEFIILRADEVIKKTGILFPRYDSYTYSQFETIRYQQNILGKKLNFGNIMIKISTQDSDLELKDIEDPEKNMLVIKDFIKKGKL